MRWSIPSLKKMVRAAVEVGFQHIRDFQGLRPDHRSQELFLCTVVQNCIFEVPQ
jgi:hypothetical protein